ncbi:MAG: DNA-protecting protein DprA [Gammaproteobacteria bacterium]|jgi:DNA processing protein|nr:DNA-protecting protein DprA [Gammaproteobacteria bacterium]
MPAPDNARAWLSLVLARGLGARRSASLAERFGSAARWAEHDDSELRESGLSDDCIRSLRRPDPGLMAACLDWLAADQHHLVTLDDPYYPPLLRRIADPPPALFLVGSPDVLVRPQVAIVGSRNATAGGIDHARAFAALLARAGLVVASGLAAGIDAAAHAGCLDSGGDTTAVLGTGADRVYPARHKALARRIIGRGALVSMFPPGTEPKPGNFPARNRIISGMSLGTLVVEAGLRSGSLITARLATDQGREVFAIPGSVHNPVARGCHRLIREGAQLVETAEEVLEALAPLAGELADNIQALLTAGTGTGLDKAPQAPTIEDDPDYDRLLDAIGFEPTPVDVIIRRSKLTTAAVSSMLLIMELDGRVAAHPGGRYSRAESSGPDKDRSE